MIADRHPLLLTLPHATLQGELVMPGFSRGIVVFVSACNGVALAGRAETETRLLQAGFGTLWVDLLSGNECHFADASTHLPHLAERLLAVIGHLRHRMDNEVIAEQPIGLVAAGDMTPLAVRVAALRDKEIHALVCHGGLVDLAGLQYLRVLQAPLLMIADVGDETSAANFRRARSHMPGIATLEQLKTDDVSAEATSRRLTVGWFERHLHA